MEDRAGGRLERTAAVGGLADTVRTVFTSYFNHLVDTELDVPAAPEL